MTTPPTIDVVVVLCPGLDSVNWTPSRGFGGEGREKDGRLEPGNMQLLGKKSIGTAVLVITALAAPACQDFHKPDGMTVPLPDDRRGQIAAAVQKLGGHVTFDAKAPGVPLVGIDLHHSRVRDADLEMLDGLVTLRTLNLYGTGIADAGLTHLSGLAGLQTLHLADAGITDAGLQHLQGLINLKELGLNQTRVTDQGLRHLEGLTSLQSLTLSGPQITDRGLQSLQGLRSLKQLFLTRTSVTDAGVRDLQRALPGVKVFRSSG